MSEEKNKKKTKKQRELEEQEELKKQHPELKGISSILEKKQIPNEIFRGQKPRYEFHIRSGYCGQSVQFDILDLSMYSGSNDGIRYMANFIDNYSRYAWVKPMREKSDIIVDIGGMIDRIRETNPKNVDYVHELRLKRGLQDPRGVPPYPEAIYSDKEAVAESVEFKNELEKRRIQWVTIEPGSKTPLAMIERFNYKLRSAITKFQENTDSTRYIDDIKEIVANYNKLQKNKGVIDATPYQIYFHQKKYKDTRKDLKPRFKIGDYVRVRKNVGLFDKKSWTEQFSREIYQIVGNASPYRFTLQQLGHEDVEDYDYKPEQMKKINYSPETHGEKEIKEDIASIRPQIKRQRQVERLIKKADLHEDLVDTGAESAKEKRKIKRPKRYEE